MRDSSDAARLVELLDGVEVGLVALASEGDVARVNNTAASLVGVSPGTIPAAEFAEALGRLAARSVDSARAESQIASVASDPLGELRTTWQFPESPQHLGVFSRPPTQPLTGGRIWVFYENSMLDEAIDAANLAYGLVRTNTDAILDPQVLVEAIRSGGKIVDLVYRDVNRATCEYLGLSRDELIGHSLMETLPNLVGSGLFEIYSNCADTGELVLLDGFPYHNELLDDLRYYDIRAAHARQDMISLTWRDVTDRIQWSQQISASEQRYRLLAENMGDVVLVIRDGRIDWISNSVEKALGAPPDYFTGRLATDFIPQDQLPAAAERLEEGTRGKSYIGPAQLLDTAGTTRAIHLHTKPFFDADGETDGLVASFHVIDEEVAARKRAQEQIELTDQRNRSLTRRLQAQTNRLMAELNSAAKYVASILPEELDGPVRVTSRLVASQELAGDSFDYQWLDDDHLMVYLIDVSGHGVESAMISVSLHNMLRIGTLPLLEPAAVLDGLNRSFQMEQHGDNYLSAWYGVYERSTRRLRYACGGHPPALVFSPADPDGHAITELGGSDFPVGTFPDTEFSTHTFDVPANTDILLYSDGAFELTLMDGAQWSHAEFVELFRRMAPVPGWSLDTLTEKLLSRAESGSFDDDCTLVLLNIP